MSFYSQFSLLDFFKKHSGLLSIQNKIPITDNYSLSLVYTPGVGQSCMEIQKDESTAFLYTNKGNSQLVITDSSGFPDFVKEKWHNNFAIPNIEAISVFYKTMTNIDAYPMVFDYRTTHNEFDLAETIINVAPAYAAIELYNIEVERLKKLIPLLESQKEKFVLFTTIEKNYLQSKIKELKLCSSLNDLFVVSCIMRAALDTRSFGLIPLGVIDEIMAMIDETDCASFNHSPFIFAHHILEVATHYFIKNGLALNKQMTQELVTKKFHLFLLEGPTSWYEPVKPSYKSSNNTMNENSLLLHRRLSGMIASKPKIIVQDPRALNDLFTEEQFKRIRDVIKENPAIATKITCKRNFSAIITNGTAVLGYGDIGSLAGLPVMEGKSCLFKQLGGVDLVPICILDKNPEIVKRIVERIHPIYNAINLEDIKAPECFEIEKPLEAKLNIPIFHDDQHGTAIVVIAAVLNCLKLVNKKAENVKLIVNGGGAAGLSITELLLKIGIKNIIICDTQGAIYKNRPKNMNKYKDALAEITNPNNVQGLLAEVIKNADIFIGVSAGKALTQDMVRSMGEKPVIFALANPIPEILPHEAKEAGAYIVATGRSDFKNQVNNSLAFPGLFRAILDVQAECVTLEMKMAAAKAIANLVQGDNLTPDHIISNALDAKVPIAVSRAVAAEAVKQKVAKEDIDPDFVEENARQYLVGGSLISSKYICV